jgi:hypothetical protein
VTVKMPRYAIVLSSVLVGLSVLASAGGLLIPGLYRDNAFVTSTWLGNDIVTLVVLAPLLALATVMAARGSARGYLAWLGLVDATLYTFGFYLFGAAFNALFLVYAALFGIGIWTMAIGLLNLDVAGVPAAFSPKTPARSVAAWSIFVGLGLSTVYTLQWLGFVMTGQLPSIIERTGHPTNIVFALDLSLVVPVLLVGGVWLWTRRPWGLALATLINVKGAVYMIGLCASTYTAYLAGTGTLEELVLWGAIGIGCIVASAFMLGRMKQADLA